MLVDVVVRDKRGQPVRDLTQADFEILEDGVPQTIGSFHAGPRRSAPGRRRRPAGRAGSSAGSAGAPLRPPPIDAGPAVTALVFHGLSPRAGKRAVQAAQAYLGNKDGDAELRRHLRHRPVADAARAVHAQRRRVCARR